MTERRVTILIIDKDVVFLEEAVTELSGHFTVHTSAAGGDGLKMFVQLRPQVVIVDAGISDIPFPDFIENLKGLDGAVLRIALSSDYNEIEKVVQAIDTGHIHKYFRKPLNYSDLAESINARTVNYQMDRGMLQGADISPVYNKLHNIIDKAKEVEKLRQQLESKMAKIKDVEEESFIKMKEALGEANALRNKVVEKDALIYSLYSKSEELEALKKRDIDRVERERAALKQELKGLLDQYDKLLREKDELSHVRSDNEMLHRENEKLREENSDLHVAVARERKTMIEELAEQRRTVEKELALKKDEAEHIVEVQKERYKAELQKIQDDFEKEKELVIREIGKLKAESEAERTAKLAEIDADRKRVEDELARKKSDAERAIELQRERNKAELQALQAAFKEEQEHAAWFEIDQLKAELEADRQAKLAEIEGDRKRVEGEIVEIRARMMEEKRQLEKSVKEQREKAETEIQRARESAVLERKKLTWELEVTLADMKKAAAEEVKELKANANRDLDRLKMASEKKERELGEAVIQARRMTRETEERLRLTENRIEVLESEIEKKITEKDMMFQELESVKADLVVAVQSREALLGELDELRNKKK